MGSPTAQGPSHARHSAHEMMLPSPNRKKISTLEMPVSQLNTQLMVSPVNASRQPSRTAAHHSGPERLARPYSAVDFHLLSFASLSWRSLELAISGCSGLAALTVSLPSASDIYLHHNTSIRSIHCQNPCFPSQKGAFCPLFGVNPLRFEMSPSAPAGQSGWLCRAPEARVSTEYGGIGSRNRRLRGA